MAKKATYYIKNNNTWGRGRARWQELLSEYQGNVDIFYYFH
jgi:hypothetical protein